MNETAGQSLKLVSVVSAPSRLMSVATLAWLLAPLQF